jgi:hypothetical protein
MFIILLRDHYILDGPVWRSSCSQVSCYILTVLTSIWNPLSQSHAERIAFTVRDSYGNACMYTTTTTTTTTTSNNNNNNNNNAMGCVNNTLLISTGPVPFSFLWAFQNIIYYLAFTLKNVARFLFLTIANSQRCYEILFIYLRMCTVMEGVYYCTNSQKGW